MFSCKELTSASWPDFEQVMGCQQGGDGGCWCTWWRLPRAQWQRLGRDGRKQYLRQTVASGQPVGVLALHHGTPCGWCAVAPVQDYPVLARSGVVKPSLRAGDWYVSCFFVPARQQRGGTMQALLQYALDFARARGANAVEACPRDAPAASGASDLFVGKTSVGGVQYEVQHPMPTTQGKTLFFRVVSITACID